MELLKIHANGQWELIKATKNQPTYSTPDDGQETPRIKGQRDYDTRTYRNTTGQLREDHGEKGKLHGNPGNSRAPKQGMSSRNWGKPAHLLPSAVTDRDPGTVQD